MSKRPSNSSGGPPTKRAHKTISLTTKLDVIRRHELGEGPAKIGRALGLPPSTASTIIKDKEKYKASSSACISPSLRTVTRVRDPKLEKLERLLMVWIEDSRQKRIPLSQALMQEKARCLWRTIISDEPSTSSNAVPQFNASRGWFDRFKKRANLHSIRMLGEAASADDASASLFPAELKKRIEEGGYSPKQVFNIDETGLYWKKMPDR